MSLKHQLCLTSVRVPELYTSIFGAGENPLVILSKCDTKHKVLHTISTELQHGRLNLLYVPRKSSSSDQVVFLQDADR
jgi:hypothetical protein